MNCIRNQLKPFKSRDQARRANFRWQVFVYMKRSSLPWGKRNHVGIIDANFIFVYDKDHIYV